MAKFVCKHCNGENEVKLGVETELEKTLTETLAQALGPLRSEISGINLDTKPISEEISKLSKTLAETPHQPAKELLAHWDSCPNCKPGWDSIKGEIVNDARKGYIPEGELDQYKSGHPTASEETVKSWEDCPECKVQWESIKKGLEDNARKGYVEEAELEKVKNVHPAASDELFSHFETCPDCKPAWDKAKDKIKSEGKEPVLASTKSEPFWSEEWNKSK